MDELDELGVRWRGAFRAARGAVAASRLPAQERAELAHRLQAEVTETQRVLAATTTDRGLRRLLPLLLSPIDARHLLGLPPEVAACVFNLDGVLVGSAALHVQAWHATFDEFLLARSERTRHRWHWELFNPRTDYTAYLHARPRLDGVREFLASRGIRLPEGEVQELADRKNEILQQLLAKHALHAFEGSRSYLELAHEAGIRCAVVSASAHTPEILEQTGLAGLVDGRIDGTTIVRDHLRVKPAPDTLLAACDLLHVPPGRTAAFETTRAGVAAGRAAGLKVVVGVDGATGADPGGALRAEGADVVVHDVGDLLEQRLAA